LYKPFTKKIDRASQKKLAEASKLVWHSRDRIALWRVLTNLNESFKVSFVCDAKRFLPELMPVEIEKMTLFHAAEKLHSIYRESDWELRESGVLIFRGPINPLTKKQSSAERAPGTD
jgi:hypothetical protein